MLEHNKETVLAIRLDMGGEEGTLRRQFNSNEFDEHGYSIVKMREKPSANVYGSGGG